MYRLALEPTKSPIQWVRGYIPTSTEVKNEWNLTSTRPVCLHDVDKEKLYSSTLSTVQLSVFHLQRGQMEKNIPFVPRPQSG
jgi:hypothetical protein